MNFAASFLIPITRVYFLTGCYFMAQGFAQAVYDLIGNDMILKLWSGISTSPINAMHAGYGIGAILAILASRNYIVFSSYDSLIAKTTGANLSTTVINSTQALDHSHDWEKINLKTPYWFAASVSLFLGLLFLVAQLFETRVILAKN